MSSTDNSNVVQGHRTGANTRTRILLLEDDEAYIHLCKRYLHADKTSNHTVISATTIAQATATFLVDSFDCVIVDYFLPDGLGTEAIEILRSLSGDIMPPVIVFTAEGGEEAAVNAVKSQASDFLIKSDVSREALCRAVDNAIEKGQLRSSNLRRLHELEIANGLLLKRNDEIQRFYHTVSHEVKTPLTAVQEFVSIVRDGLAGEVVEEQKTILQYALDGCAQLNMQFNEMLELTQFETGKLSVQLCPSDIYSVFDHCIVGATPEACAKGITLSIEDQQDLPLIMMQSNRIKQVLSNLINNAIKFTDQGGHITVSAQLIDNGAQLQIKVIDTGCGIPEKDLNQIFDRLYQVTPNSDRKDETGLGLGLNIAAEIIKLHGSSIQVHSKVGEGSVFSFELLANENKQTSPGDLNDKAA